MGRLGTLWPNHNEADAALEEVQQRADDVTRDHWADIAKVADALLERRRLTGEEVASIIGSSVDADQGC
jgi:ATP-dependent Zn protease